MADDSGTGFFVDCLDQLVDVIGYATRPFEDIDDLGLIVGDRKFTRCARTASSYYSGVAGLDVIDFTILQTAAGVDDDFVASSV